MHTRFLLVEGEKMSKSKGNFFTVRDVLEGRVTGRPVDPAVLRYELLKSHYRNNANFTKKGLEDSASAVDRFRKAVEKARGGQIAATDGDVDVDLEHPMVKAFAQALADDLNMSAALAQVFGRLNDLGEDAESLQALLAINSVLNILPSGDTSSGGDSDADATGASESTEALCKEIDAARANKDFETADAVRQQLTDAGYEVTTTKEGTIARKKLA
jgi:cysteinyl-tRNA synthetase